MEKQITSFNETEIDDKILSELKIILDEVKVWLHFAEAKHGALLAINLGLIFKCTDFFLDINKKVMIGNKKLLFIIIVLYIFSTIISFISFVPNVSSFSSLIEKKLYKLKKKFLRKNNINENKDVTINFYGNISNYDDYKKYLKDLYKKFNVVKKDNFIGIHCDYSKQIIINSKITTNKFYLFKLAIYIEIIATILLIVFLFISFL